MSRTQVDAGLAGQAVETVRSKRMSYRGALHAFGVSIQKRLSGTVSIDSRVGPGTVLTPEEETFLTISDGLFLVFDPTHSQHPYCRATLTTLPRGHVSSVHSWRESYWVYVLTELCLTRYITLFMYPASALSTAPVQYLHLNFL